MNGASKLKSPTSKILVRSFSPTGKRFGDFAAVEALFGARPEAGAAVRIGVPGSTPLYVGWSAGEQLFPREGEYDK